MPDVVAHLHLPEMDTMDSLLQSTDLRDQAGAYTVYSHSSSVLEAFQSFQLAVPNNPMRYSRDNRDSLRGEFVIYAADYSKINTFLRTHHLDRRG